MRSIKPLIAAVALTIATSGYALAVEGPSDLARLIDERIDQQIPSGGQAELLDDSGFLRRVTLDLAGRIPTVAELRQFESSESPTKRADVVQQLIDSPDFAFHQRNELDTLLLRRLSHDDQWRAYLLEATRENRSWDQMFREILCPDEYLPEDPRPAAFLVRRLNDLDSMANDACMIWFGVNISCAKCHDHPLVDDWKQAHYFGMASFFKRTYRTQKGLLAERFEGRIQYETTGGEAFDADFMYLTGTKIAEPPLEWDEATKNASQEAIKKAEQDAQAAPPPRPDFRPRTALVDLALADQDKRFLARNIANRIWARMIGRGLVHPLDQMHSENKASHPELLDALSNDLIEHHYDLKRLIHGIALSNTYARRMPDAESANEFPDELFAAALPRPLSPHQLSLSFRIATTNPENMSGLAGDAEWSKRREELERQSESVARQLDIPDDDFQVSVAEALWMSNNSQIQNDYLSASPDRLIGYLSHIESSGELIAAATRSILTREPTAEEQSAITAYLDSRTDHRPEAVAQVVWALLASSEFRFNH